ncbi:hypothetical protein Mgra_00001871 [Meloidogyne graminicola]|uniref:WD repeat-containing protein 54 beta-propeller domain-containing protein n=1 Tax=Meloidogyne graminicola TaxID=189291 RepID=A0A8S9ZZT3_9BILA|nr:hypothetical protein Mgra_00001871 [Meloidogyne graminicola]
MFEPTFEFPVKTGAAFLSNNLSVYNNKTKGETFVGYLGKDSVQLLSWNEKMEQECCELLTLEEIIKNLNEKIEEKSISLMQIYVTLPINRNTPILIILSGIFVSIFDFKTRKCLFNKQIINDNYSNENKKILTTFTRGICCIENLILLGCNSGEIIQIYCNNENNFQIKKNLKEHNNPITDIAFCSFDLITVTGDVGGNILVWPKNFKSVSKRISTNQPLSVINILRKQVFCGNLLGQISVYSAISGALLAEINAHSRQITALSVATESAYILTASEDTYVRIWKLHSRNPDAYKIEFRYAQRFDNMPIVGANFANTRGSGYLVSFYENFKMLLFKITRPAQSNQENKIT